MNWNSPQMVMAYIIIGFIIAMITICLYFIRKADKIEKEVNAEKRKPWPPIFEQEDQYASMEAIESIL